MYRVALDEGRILTAATLQDALNLTRGFGRGGHVWFAGADFDAYVGYVDSRGRLV